MTIEFSPDGPTTQGLSAALAPNMSTSLVTLGSGHFVLMQIHTQGGVLSALYPPETIEEIISLLQKNLELLKQGPHLAGVQVDRAKAN